MFSIWEQEHFLKSDVLIVGAGITGLSLAAALLESRPQLQVRVLERGIFPSGASTKNAGFSCLGSLSELADNLENYSEQEVAASLHLKAAGLDLLRKRIGEKNMDYRAAGGYELLLRKHAHLLEQLDRLNAFTQQAIGKALFKPIKKPDFRFPKEKLSALIHLPEEGDLNTGKMMQYLLRYVRGLGAEVLTGCKVEKLEEGGQEVRLWVQNPTGKQAICFSAPQAAVCTNAFAPALLPGLDISPGRGQVLLTEPIPDLPFRGAFHFDKGYFYFRDLHKRVLFGGGRNLYAAQETTTDMDTTEAVQNTLLTYLREIVLPDYPEVTITQRWAGIMGFQASGLLPIVESRGERLVLGVGHNGMGVAAGSEVGRQLAQLLLGA